MTLRVSEVYSSAQGEGPNVGKTTIFVRFAGCNLRCPGWPCDTPFAIYPEEYRHQWKTFEPWKLLEHIIKEAALVGANNITFTGGEPLLQRNSGLLLVSHALKERGFVLDCFSNGTIEYPEWATNKISFIMDWKLPGSGENPYDKTRIENLGKLATSPLPQAIKFVCKDLDDIIEAKALWYEHILEKAGRKNIEVYYGKVWDGNITDAELAEYVMARCLPWRLNIQTHNIVWPAHERRR